MARTKVDYVEFPFDRVVSVNWASGGVMTVLSVSFFANNDFNSNSVYEPDTVTTMSVEVGGLPGLDADLEVAGIPGDDSTFRSEVSGSFPDGSHGTITATYQLNQSSVDGELSGLVQYTTTAQGADRFGGVNDVSISIAFTLRPLNVGPPIFPRVGYDWGGGAGFAAGSVNLGDALPPGNRLSFSGGPGSVTGSFSLTPPSVSVT